MQEICCFGNTNGSGCGLWDKAIPNLPDLARSRCDVEHVARFQEEEVKQWLERQCAGSETNATRIWAVIQRERGDGRGLSSLQDWDGAAVVEVGCCLKKDAWHQGYATEAAVACKEYAFDTLGCSQVYSMIRENNRASPASGAAQWHEACGDFDEALLWDGYAPYCLSGG